MAKAASKKATTKPPVKRVRKVVPKLDSSVLRSETEAPPAPTIVMQQSGKVPPLLTIGIIVVIIVVLFFLLKGNNNSGGNKKVEANAVKIDDSLAFAHAIERGVQPLYIKLDSANTNILEGLQLDRQNNERLNTVLSYQQEQRQQNKKLTDAITQKLTNPNTTDAERDSIERALIHAIYLRTKVHQ